MILATDSMILATAEEAKPGDITQWMFDSGIVYLLRSSVINPHTFQPSITYQLKTEEDKTLFLLKWGNR